ncbi:MAG: ATP-binding protein, partial [Elusimicrobiota bacterium]
LPGYLREEILEKDYFELFINKEERIEDYFYEILNKKNENQNYHINHIIKKDGTKPLIMWTNFVIEDNDENVETISFGYDITFRSEYMDDISKINALVRSFTQNYEDNIKKIVELAKEISGAKIVMFNVYNKEKNTFSPYFILGSEDFPKEFDAKDSLCGKVLEKDMFDYEEVKALCSDNLVKNKIIRYYGISIDKENKTGVFCFFYDRELHLKRNRLSILAKILENEYKRHIFLKQTESEKERFFNLLESLPLGVIYADRKTREILYINSKMEEITGYPVCLIKEKNLDFLKELIIDKELIEDFVINPKNYPLGVDIKGKRADGEVRTIHYSLGNYMEKDRILLLISDVTYEKKRIERINSYTKELTLFSQIDFIIIKSSHDKVYEEVLNFIRIYFSAEYGLIGFLNKEKDEFIIKHMSGNVADNCHIGDLIEYKKFLKTGCIWARTLKEGSVNIMHAPKDIPGHVPIFNALSVPLKIEENVISVVMLANRKDGWNSELVDKLSDILNYVSQRLYYVFENEKLLKEKIESQIKMSNTESIIKMTGGIAHNINNMLVPLISNLTLIRSKIKEDEVLNMIDEVYFYSSSISNIAKELLNISNPKMVSKEMVSVADILKIIDVLSKGLFLKIDINVDKNIKNLSIYIDKSQFTQILTNLITNASHAMENKEEKKIDIKVSKTFKSEKEYLMIMIKDYGVGIKEEDKSKIFSIYFTTKIGGKGLGLFMVKRLVENMGGEVFFESKEGVGTEFFVLIPIDKNNNTTNIVGEQKVEFKPSNLNNLKVLIIDDEDFVIKSLTRLFSHFGLNKVKGVLNSRDALKELRDEKYNIVIIDLILKNDAKGQELNLKIKEIIPDIFSVVSSGYTDDDVMDNISKYKFDYKLPKPYKLKDIEDLLSFYLSHRT